MADHLKLQILKKLTQHLEGITLNNHYSHDLNGHVFRGRSLIGADESIPCLNLIESPSALDGFFADMLKTVRKDTWIILLQGWAEADPIHPADKVYALLADVQRRLSDIVALQDDQRPRFPGIYNLGGLTSDFEIGADVVRPAEEGLSTRPFFYLPIRVTVSLNLTDPTYKVD